MQYLSQRLASRPAPTPGGQRPASAISGGQRSRILDATEGLIGEEGRSAASIEAIVKRAGVSSITFYEHFADKEACFVAAFDRAVGESVEILAAAAGTGEGREWSGRVRAALAALLELVAAEPERARFCLLEAPSGGPGLTARYGVVADQAATELRRGRLLESAPRDLPETLEEASVGSIAWLLRERLERGEASRAGDLLPELIQIALEPYVDEGLHLSAVGRADSSDA